MAECLQRQRPISMVLLSAADLREIPELLGRKVANDLFIQAAEVIGAVPGDGIAARTEPLEFALLLPGMNPTQAAALLVQRLGEPAKLSLMVAGRTVVVELDMAIGEASDPSADLEQLYDSLHAKWAERANTAVAGSKSPVLGPDEPRAQASRRDTSPTVPIPLPARARLGSGQAP
jgi:GGDEF domain-containing protein